jgi:hypothetical protein
MGKFAHVKRAFDIVPSLITLVPSIAGLPKQIISKLTLRIQVIYTVHQVLTRRQ